MEEADHLADRVGVLAKRMIDIGTTSHLRDKHGYGFHIQLICASAPHTSPEDMETVKAFVEQSLPGAKLEGFAYHGQMRYNLPAHRASSTDISSDQAAGSSTEKVEADTELSVGKLFVLLEENKERLGLEFYSVSPSTFDEVFLRVVEKHNIREEDTPTRKMKWYDYLKMFLPFLFI